MKKTILAILAILYLGTSTGTTIHLHYCMGKLAGWGLSQNEANQCGKCGMKKVAKKENGCCKDEQKFFKADSDQKLTNLGLNNIQSIDSELPISFFELPTSILFALIEIKPICQPPPGSAVALYIRNCFFLI